MRDMLAAIIPVELLSPTADKDKPLPMFGGKSLRYIMQTLGTAWGRKLISETIWVDALVQWAVENGVQKLVVDDVRFDNEYEALKKNGATIVALCRKGVDPKKALGSHASEVDWARWKVDYFTENEEGKSDHAAAFIQRWVDSRKLDV
jgi:hypothetical protein